MPRGRVNKIDIESRVYKLKQELYNGTHHNKGKEWHDGAHNALNRILDMLSEYYQ